MRLEIVSVRARHDCGCLHADVRTDDALGPVELELRCGVHFDQDPREWTDEPRLLYEVLSWRKACGCTGWEQVLSDGTRPSRTQVCWDHMASSERFMRVNRYAVVASCREFIRPGVFTKLVLE